MLTGALVPRRGTDAGVPGPRRSADECDAGWFAPVATRRRSLFFQLVLSLETGLLGLAELDDRDRHHGEPHDGHDAERQTDRNHPAAPGHTRRQPLLVRRGDGQVAE